MEGLNALTPNTAAFLDSLTMSDLAPSKDMDGGFPPSAFFPVPGRDTPEDSSPSSVGDAKPKTIASDESDQEAPAASHKRKAHKPTETLEDDEDDGASYLFFISRDKTRQRDSVLTFPRLNVRGQWP